MVPELGPLSAALLGLDSLCGPEYVNLAVSNVLLNEHVNLAAISNVLVNEYVNLAAVSNVPKTKYMASGPKSICCQKLP